MPVVESYGPRRIRRAPLPRATRSAASTPTAEGAGLAQAQQETGRALGTLGEGIGGAGEALAKVVEEQRQETDDIARLGWQNQFATFEQNVIYDPQTGALAQRGAAAFELPVTVSQAFEKLSGEIEAGLTTDRQRVLYARDKLTAGSGMAITVRRHVEGEMQRYHQGTFEARVGNHVNAAIVNAQDPVRLRFEIDGVEDVIRTHAPRLGQSPEQVEGLVGKAHSAIHAGVVDRLLATGNDLQAQAYFAQTRSQITDGATLERLERAVEEGSVRGESQRQAAQILAQTSTEKDARARAKQIADPKVQDEVLSRIEHEFVVRDRQQREDHEQLVTRGKNIIDQTGSWRSIPANEWVQYTVGEASALKNYAEQKAQGVPVKTDPATYYSLVTAATSPDPTVRTEFLTTNLLRYVDRLSTSDFQQLADAQGRIRANDTKQAEALLTNEAAQNRMVDDALLDMGLDPTPPQPGTKPHNPQVTARVSAFRRAVREAVSRLEVREQRKATDPEVQSIVDQLRAPTGQRKTKDGWIWDAFEQAYAFETPQAQVAKVEDVPLQERRRIEAALRAENVPVTDEAILKFFNLALTRTRKDR